MPGSATNKKLMSSAMATKKAAQLVVLLQPPVKVDDYAMTPSPRQECSVPRCQYLTPEGILLLQPQLK